MNQRCTFLTEKSQFPKATRCMNAFTPHCETSNMVKMKNERDRHGKRMGEGWLKGAAGGMCYTYGQTALSHNSSDWFTITHLPNPQDHKPLRVKLSPSKFVAKSIQKMMRTQHRGLGLDSEVSLQVSCFEYLVCIHCCYLVELQSSSVAGSSWWMSVARGMPLKFKSRTLLLDTLSTFWSTVLWGASTTHVCCRELYVALSTQ